MGVSDILDGSFKLIRSNPRTVLGLSALFSLVQVAITTTLQAVASNDLGHYKITDSGDQTTSLGPLLGGELTTLVSVLIKTLIGTVLTGLLVVVITQDVLGIRIGIGQAWAKVRPRIWALLGLSLVTSVLEGLGLLPCFVLGVWLWGIWAVAAPALVVEGRSIGGALSRSKNLVDGMFWRVWGIRALGWLLATVVTGIITVPFEVIGFVVTGADFSDLTGGGLPIAAQLIAAVGALIGSTLVAPILAGIDSLLYVDLRMRKEGLDIVLQQADMRRVR